MGYPLLEWAFALFRSRMNELSSISVESEARLIAALDNLDAVEAARLSYIISDAGTQVLPGGTVFYRASKLAELSAEMNYWRGELSALLSLSPINSSSSSRRLS